LIVPCSADIVKCLELEGSGKSCEALAMRLLTKNEDRITEANRQARKNVGRPA
jgi:hypothetical protein